MLVKAQCLLISIECLDRILCFVKINTNMGLINDAHMTSPCENTLCKWLKLEFKTITEALYVSSECYILSIQPNFIRSYGSSIEQCSQLKGNDQIEFDFVLAEPSSSKTECTLSHCILDACIVTHKFFSWSISIATANYEPSLHCWYQESISDWSCFMLTKDKHVKRDTNALAMLSNFYIYDKLNYTL